MSSIAMGKVVLDHYPAERLPAELREGLAADAKVRVTVEPEASSSEMAKAAFIRKLDAIRERGEKTTIEEAVARIRSLRDEWEN